MHTRCSTYLAVSNLRIWLEPIALCYKINYLSGEVNLYIKHYTNYVWHAGNQTILW